MRIPGEKRSSSLIARKLPCSNRTAAMHINGPTQRSAIANWSSQSLGWIAAAFLVILGGTAACSTRSEEKRPSAPPATSSPGLTPKVSAMPALPTNAYFSEATALFLFQIQAAKIALKRGGPEGRAFATCSKQHHEALAVQLSFAGRRLNLLPSRSLPSDYQQLLHELISARNFDQVYFSQQKVVCSRGFELHNNYNREGASPTLRPVAQFGAKVISEELESLAL